MGLHCIKNIDCADKLIATIDRTGLSAGAGHSGSHQQAKTGH